MGPVWLANFEIYRSGANARLRCRGCRQSWHIASCTGLADVYDQAAGHVCEGSGS